MVEETGQIFHIVRGLRTLCAERRPGQTFTCDQIAERLGSSSRIIRNIERAAMQNVCEKLFTHHQPMLRELEPELLCGGVWTQPKI